MSERHEHTAMLIGWRRALLILWIFTFLGATVVFMTSFCLTVAFASNERRQPSPTRSEVMSERGVHYFITPVEHAILGTARTASSILHPIALLGGLVIGFTTWRQKQRKETARAFADGNKLCL